MPPLTRMLSRIVSLETYRSVSFGVCRLKIVCSSSSLQLVIVLSEFVIPHHR
eukprot:m.267312 g.267312  ORF g.267312 m.267312 type:complete len:52 (-) comp16246_c1_seq26:569-724(-)